MAWHALFVAGVWLDIDVPYDFKLPTVAPPSSLEYTPYGPAWAENSGLRAGEGRLLLSVGGTSQSLAADNSSFWLGRALQATRIRFNPTGRYLQIARVGEIPIETGRGQMRYEMNLKLEFQNPYWHSFEGDNSTRLLP